MISESLVRWFDNSQIKHLPIIVNGYGINEATPRGLIDRPIGTGDYLLMCFLKGATILGEGGEIAVIEGDFGMLWRPGERQYYQGVSQKSRHTWVHFEGAAVKPLLSNHKVEAGAPLHIPVEFYQLLLGLLNAELNSEFNAKVIEHIFSLLITKISTYQRVGGSLFGSSKLNKEVIKIPDKYYEVKSFIEFNFSRHVALEELAEITNSSVSHFCSCFKKYFKVSAIQYMNQLRMNKADYYLKDINKNISEISEILGYCDIYQFSKQFKKYFGISPSERRRQFNEKIS